jgi:hypothetical protein
MIPPQNNPFFKSTPEETYAVTQGLLPWTASLNHQQKKPLPKIYSAADLMLKDMEKPKELIQGVLHQGLKGVLASSSKAGKTWLLLDMALSVASGLQWIKWQTTKAKVLVVNFEIPEFFLRDRIQLLTHKKAELGQYDLSNLHLWTLRGFNSGFGDLLQEISRTIKNENYGLVIIDPVYKGLAGADENHAGDVALLCNNFESLCVQTGAAVVYAHHFSKGNKANQHPLDRMSGSGVFGRDADSIILLTDHEEKDCYTVELVLRNLPRVPPFVAEWEFPLMNLREDLFAGDLAGRGGRKMEHNAEDLLESLTVPMTHTEWKKLAKKKLNMSAATFNRLLDKLKLDNLIEQPAGQKLWQAVS